MFVELAKNIIITCNSRVIFLNVIKNKKICFYFIKNVPNTV